MSAVSSAQTQGLQRAPPPGQPTGPVTPQPAPGAQPIYEDGPDALRYEGNLAVVDRDAMAAKLARMEDLLERALDRMDRGPGRNQLLKLGDELDMARRDLNNAPDLRRYRPRPQPQPQPPPPPPPPVVYPITEDQLQQLSKAIARESFGDGKLRVLESAASQKHFLVPQVLKLLQRFTFAEDRLNAVRVLWPRVLDRENAYQLYGAFSFSTEKDELRKIIGQ
ncbi:MAG TPA: DUF4476 domain-containing protein [Myxococcaceae bacterium]|jgi:hypothetical protein